MNNVGSTAKEQQRLPMRNATATREYIQGGERSTQAGRGMETEAENGEVINNRLKISSLLSRFIDLLATCIAQQEDIHYLDDMVNDHKKSVAQLTSHIQLLEQLPIAAPGAGSSNYADRLDVLEIDVRTLKTSMQLQQAATQQLEQQICAAAAGPTTSPHKSIPKLDGQPIFCGATKTEPILGFASLNSSWRSTRPATPAGGGCIGEAKRHHCELVVAEARPKGSLRLILCSDANLMVTAAKINLRKEAVTCQTVEQLVDTRHGVAILKRVAVNWVKAEIIDAEMKSFIRFASKEDGCTPRGVAGFNETPSQELLKLTLEFSGFGDREFVRCLVVNTIVRHKLDGVLNVTHRWDAEVRERRRKNVVVLSNEVTNSGLQVGRIACEFLCVSVSEQRRGVLNGRRRKGSRDGSHGDKRRIWLQRDELGVWTGWIIVQEIRNVHNKEGDVVLSDEMGELSRRGDGDRGRWFGHGRLQGRRIGTSCRSGTYKRYAIRLSTLHSENQSVGRPIGLGGTKPMRPRSTKNEVVPRLHHDEMCKGAVATRRRGTINRLQSEEEREVGEPLIEKELGLVISEGDEDGSRRPCRG
ncbi:hypothetical protein CBR_g44411 [Chara braunii]|uniref:Uncharacterized protein n=1 Tax=Chara braunii TaxID=69332 RepID=A0A388LXB2_CHABU|nr:hypothetical protein CBR_g44411 [Chara braunii]|eukprot:GBG86958.1 hypothetical protein CBR_g44411 [Chara braunii]